MLWCCVFLLWESGWGWVGAIHCNYFDHVIGVRLPSKAQSTEKKSTNLCAPHEFLNKSMSAMFDNHKILLF